MSYVSKPFLLENFEIASLPSALSSTCTSNALNCAKQLYVKKIGNFSDPLCSIKFGDHICCRSLLASVADLNETIGRMVFKKYRSVDQLRLADCLTPNGRFCHCCPVCIICSCVVTSSGLHPQPGVSQAYKFRALNLAPARRLGCQSKEGNY